MLPSSDENEEMLLSGTIDHQSNSRLTCQVIVASELDGMIVRWPESQY